MDKFPDDASKNLARNLVSSTYDGDGNATAQTSTTANASIAVSTA
jgi:hypothetical protein